MNKIKEFFGCYCKDKMDIKEILKTQLCPYTGNKCIKIRKSTPEISIGTCSIEYQNKPIIICPFRMIENNQIFIDCLHLLTMHEPGNELYILPEISIPGGMVDYFLVSARSGKVMDFVGIEIQTLDTTGTVWPERQRLLKENGVEVSQEEINSNKKFGMNWKMTAKTILIQMHHKSETFEHINKHLVLVIQNQFYDYMNKEFNFEHIKGVRVGDCTHIHSYNINENKNKMLLALETRVSTDAEGISKCLGLHGETKVALEEIIKKLENKLSDDYRFKII